MNKVVLISLDAVSETEFDRLAALPNFKRFIEKGVYSKGSISVYPTQTYTVHTSVITGNYPDKHGVYSNQFFQPFVKAREKEWFWYRHQVKCDTLYDAVKQNGGEVSSVLWPVTGKSKMKHYIPEIMAVKNENQAIKVMKNSSVPFAVRCEVKYGTLRKGISQPQLDRFAKASIIDTIKRHKPSLAMVHLVIVDAFKHQNGVESPEIDKALKMLDDMVGEILKAGKDEYTYIMFSDHGQFTVEKEVYLNVLLKEHGLLNFESKEFEAYIESMGGSAVIRFKNESALKKTLKLLNDNKDMLGIEDIYSREMLDKIHISKGIEYIIEAKKGYHFKEVEFESAVRDVKKENITHATHGYNPLKSGYKCVFFAMGGNIKQNYEVKKMDVVDIAPTIARIMGIGNFECDGRALLEIFEK